MFRRSGPFHTPERSLLADCAAMGETVIKAVMSKVKRFLILEFLHSD
jgi:hypothetical protein